MRRDTESKRVGIWLRVSTEDQVKGESPETHERRARLYAEAKGWTVVDVYRLDAVSGKTIKEHAEAQRMLEDVKSGHITGLIFSKLARVARNTKELLEFADIFREYGADLISLAESIDTSSPAGRLFYTIIAAMAQWEREEISARVAASVPIRAQMGKPLGGAAPFGYQWKDKKLVLDEKEAPVRKLMYELFQSHKRKKAVARLLNDRGFRTRNGSKFSDTTVDRLLRDETAKGWHIRNHTKSTNSNKAWVAKPESEWIRHPCDPIVSDDLWNDVNAILDQQRAKGKRPARTTVHLFAGLTFCHCGQKMYVPSNSPKYVCQKCRNKLPVDDLEAVFRQELLKFVFSPEQIAEHRAAGHAEITAKADLVRVLEAEQDKLTRESDKLYQLYQSGALDVEGFGNRNKPIAERLKQLDDEIPRIQAEGDVLRIALQSQEVVIAEAQALFAGWQTLSQEDKRAVVETIAERITIKKEGVSIRLHFDPPIPSTNDPAPSSGSHGTHGNKATQLHGFIAATN